MIIHYHYVQRDRGTITILSLYLHFLYILKFNAITSHIISLSLFFQETLRSPEQRRPSAPGGHVWVRILPQPMPGLHTGHLLFFPCPEYPNCCCHYSTVHGLDWCFPDIISIVVGKWNNPEYGASRMKSFNFF